MSKSLFSLPAVLFLTAAVSSAATTISVNFSENDTNQVFAGGQNIGPLATNSSNWNSTSPAVKRSGSLGTGSLIAPLIDSTGAATTAMLSWASSGAYYNSVDGTGTDQQKLSVGYLDDGGTGFTVTVTGVPFAQYRIYGLLSSDAGDGVPTTYSSSDYTVNGTAVFGQTVTAYGNLADSNTAEGAQWTLLEVGNVGNYWMTGTKTGSTLTITGVRAGASRASITGFIIEQVPEPSAAILGALGGLVLLRRRRD